MNLRPSLHTHAGSLPSLPSTKAAAAFKHSLCKWKFIFPHAQPGPLSHCSLYPEGAQPFLLPPCTEVTWQTRQLPHANRHHLHLPLRGTEQLAETGLSWQKGRRRGLDGRSQEDCCCLGPPPTGISALHNPACPTGSEALSYSALSGPQELTAGQHLQFHDRGALR